MRNSEKVLVELTKLVSYIMMKSRIHREMYVRFGEGLV